MRCSKCKNRNIVVAVRPMYLATTPMIYTAYTIRCLNCRRIISGNNQQPHRVFTELNKRPYFKMMGENIYYYWDTGKRATNEGLNL